MVSHTGSSMVFSGLAKFVYEDCTSGGAAAAGAELDTGIDGTSSWKSCDWGVRHPRLSGGEAARIPAHVADGRADDRTPAAQPACAAADRPQRSTELRHCPAEPPSPGSSARSWLRACGFCEGAAPGRWAAALAQAPGQRCVRMQGRGAGRRRDERRGRRRRQGGDQAAAAARSAAERRSRARGQLFGCVGVVERARGKRSVLAAAGPLGSPARVGHLGRQGFQTRGAEMRPSHPRTPRALNRPPAAPPRRSPPPLIGPRAARAHPG
jgi:hypothetical protein